MSLTQKSENRNLISKIYPFKKETERILVNKARRNMIRLKMHVTASLMKPLTMPLMHPLKMPLATRPSLTHMTPFLNMLPLKVHIF